MEGLVFHVRYFLVKIIRLFFSFLNGGENCVVCNKHTFLFPICKDCIKEKFSVDKILSKNRCNVCGKIMLSTETKCMNCRNTEVFKNVNKLLPFFAYKLWNKELLVMWKISSVRVLSEFFAKIIFEVCQKLDIKIVVPVPPRPGKITKEGWDQIDELCNFLQYKYKIIVLKLLKRSSIQEQKKLSREERLNKIGKSFCVESDDKIKNELKKNRGIIPESVYLLDDVITTGSTVESCSEELKKLGIKEINVLSLFYVD